MKRSTAHALHALALVGFLATVVVSVFCSPGIGPVSDEVGVLIEPPSWTFIGAWSLIYLLCLVFCIWQFFPGAYASEAADVSANALFCAVCGLCALWIVLFSSRLYATQAAVVCATALGALALCGLLNYRSGNLALRLCMSVFAAWLVLASVLGVMACVKALGWAGGAPERLPAVRDLDHSVEYCVALAVAVVAEAGLSAWLVSPGPSLVALWGLAGVGASLYAEPAPSDPGRLSALQGLRLLVICGAVIHVLSLVLTSVLLGLAVRRAAGPGSLSWSSCGPVGPVSSLLSDRSAGAGSRSGAPAAAGSSAGPAEAAPPEEGGPAAPSGAGGDPPAPRPRRARNALRVSRSTSTELESQTTGRKKSPTEISSEGATPLVSPPLKGWLQGRGKRKGYVPLSPHQDALPA